MEEDIIFPRQFVSVALCIALSPGAALADRDHHRHRHSDGQEDRHYRHAFTQVVYRPVYVAPRRVVYAEPGYYYYPPRHAEHHHHHRCDHDRAMLVLGSAILAGAIVHELRR